MHLTGQRYTDEQVDRDTDFLAFLTIHAMSNNGASTHEMEAIADSSFKLLSDSIDKNPTKLFSTSDGSKPSRYWRNKLASMNEIYTRRRGFPQGIDGTST